jgi:hypothetical protein
MKTDASITIINCTELDASWQLVVPCADQDHGEPINLFQCCAKHVFNIEIFRKSTGKMLLHYTKKNGAKVQYAATSTLIS